MLTNKEIKKIERYETNIPYPGAYNDILRVWRENGQVKQSGLFSQPEVLMDYNGKNDRLTKLRCQSFIAGMLAMSKIIKGE